MRAIIRPAIAALAVICILAFSRDHAAMQTAVAGAAIAWALIRWKDSRSNTGQIVKAATALAHAFALTNSPCIDETRALSRAVFLGGKDA